VIVAGPDPELQIEMGVARFPVGCAHRPVMCSECPLYSGDAGLRPVTWGCDGRGHDASGPCGSFPWWCGLAWAREGVRSLDCPDPPKSMILKDHTGMGGRLLRAYC